MAAKKKKVTFGKITAEEERTSTIKAEGFEPFEITYRIPNKLAAAIDIAVESDDAGRGSAVIKYIARHLIAWSLPPEPTEENISALNDAEVLFSVFNEIAAGEGQVKN